MNVELGWNIQSVSKIGMGRLGASRPEPLGKALRVEFNMKRTFSNSRVQTKASSRVQAKASS